MKPSRNIIAVLALLASCILMSAVGVSAAAAHRGAHTRVYKGTGVVTAVDTESDVITVDFTSANRALRNALGGDLSNVEVAVGEDTEFSINGDDTLDLSDLCSDDTVTVVIKTTARLSGHNLTEYPATVVAASADPGECED